MLKKTVTESAAETVTVIWDETGLHGTVIGPIINADAFEEDDDQTDG